MIHRPSVRSLVVAGACALGTCGAGTAAVLTSTAEAAGTTIKITANAHGKLMFNTKTLKAKAGKITIVMINPKTAGVAHGIAVQGHGVDKDSKFAKPGQTVSLTVTLKKGSYAFYCPVDHHEQAGMKGTLVVS
jgi:uncharacterized cupredoxin-like copper-binding protein